jgi:hypothetical protein
MFKTNKTKSKYLKINVRTIKMLIEKLLIWDNYNNYNLIIKIINKKANQILNILA